MKILEIMLPPSAKEMADLGKSLLLDYRALAKKFGITIDGGGQSAHDGLPVLRKDFMLFGGYLTPNGGERGEAKRTESFEKRARDFLVTLHKELLKLQVKGLGDDLELTYRVSCGHAWSKLGPFKAVDEFDPKGWYDGAGFGINARSMPTIGPITWMVAK